MREHQRPHFTASSGRREETARWVGMSAGSLALLLLVFVVLPLALAGGTAHILPMRGSSSPFHIFQVTPGSRTYHPVLAVGNDAEPRWSPDGRRVAFASDAGQGYQINVADADGSHAHALAPGDSGMSIDPAWSPDGSQIVFASNRSGDFDLYVVNADGRGLHDLTDHPGLERMPAWSPDGTRIAFAGQRAANSDLYVVNVDGSGEQRLTSGPARDRSPVWSADGERLVFVSNGNGNADLFSLDVLSGRTVQLTSTESTDVQPAWSPDGSTLTFASNRTGNWNIFTMPSSGGAATQITFDRATDRGPSWSPDGTTVIFSSDHSTGDGSPTPTPTPTESPTASPSPTPSESPSPSPSPTASPSPSPSPTEPPVQSGAAWGIFSEPRGGKGGQEIVDTLEGQIGRPFTGQRIYENMDAPFPDPIDQLVKSEGGLIYHNFNSWYVNGSGQKICYRWSDIVAGKYNALLAAMARDVKAFDYPIYLSFTHEPTANVPNHPRCGTAAEYRAAYDHVWTVFHNQGATNVTWVWTNTAAVFQGQQGGPDMWAPAHYDVVGVDGYNRSFKWRSPSYVFGPVEAYARAHGKAILIGEIGCDELRGKPTAKADWYTTASAMFRGWDNLVAVLWTNTDNGGLYWIDSSSQALKAFAAASKSFS
jgi:WD40-like Beta Propeller Repeat